MAERATILLILSLAGGAGFLASFIALNLGLAAMWLRYALAGVVAYLTFLLLLRLWARQYRRRTNRDVPDVDFGTVDVRRGSGPDFTVGGGGRSGGGGASASWDTPRASFLDGVGSAWDLDEGWPVVLVPAVALGGVLAIFYVIYIAPVLLAELAVDAAMVSAAYGRLRKKDLASRVGVVRRTWLPATALILTLAFAGWVMQLSAPGARSIGGVVAALRG